MGPRHAAAEPGRGCVLPVLELCRGVAAARTQPEGPPGLWKGGSRASSECRAPQHGPSPGRAERRSCHRWGRLWAAAVSPAGKARCAAARTVATTFSLARVSSSVSEQPPASLPAGACGGAVCPCGTGQQ